MSGRRGEVHTDISWVMGHVHLSTTQRYLNSQIGDVIESMLAFYAKDHSEAPSTMAEGYRKESIEVLFGQVEQ